MRAFLQRTIYNRSYVLDLMVGLLLITTIYFLVGQRNQTEQLRDIANSNKVLNSENKDLLEQVRSCTDPNGACYKANSATTAGVVVGINQVSLLAAACADKDGSQTVAEVKKCVLDGLKSK